MLPASDKRALTDIFFVSCTHLSRANSMYLTSLCSKHLNICYISKRAEFSCLPFNKKTACPGQLGRQIVQYGSTFLLVSFTRNAHYFALEAIQFKGVLHPSPKISMFGLYLKSINTFVKKDVIKQNESELAKTVFKIQPNKANSFFYFFLFVQSFNCLYLWNQLPNLCGVFTKSKLKQYPIRKCPKNKNHIFQLQTHFAWSHHICIVQ